MNLEKLVNETEEEIGEVFKKINKVCEANSSKVLNAFRKYKLSDTHFGMTTGYGYGDVGRDIIEEIYSEILHAEDSLVRTQFVSGTHAISTALFAVLRPGDTVISINGKPYDTLDKIIGIEENKSSLKSLGIKYEQIDLTENEFDIEKIKQRVSERKYQINNDSAFKRLYIKKKFFNRKTKRNNISNKKYK